MTNSKRENIMSLTTQVEVEKIIGKYIKWLERNIYKIFIITASVFLIATVVWIVIAILTFLGALH